jgi:hypothetical protein
MQATICRHIKTNGRVCNSPSLGQSAFCYFHSRLHRRHKHLVETAPVLRENHAASISSAPEATQPHPECVPLELDLPALEDAESIQVSISLLVAALARNRIDSKRAAVLLYGLQLASTNSRSITIEPYATSVVRTLSRTKSGHDLAIREEPAPKKSAPRRPEAEPDIASTSDCL